jgi:hypothetical protein
MEEVKGWTVLKRLRAGDQPEDVARLLRTSGEDQGASASQRVRKQTRLGSSTVT